MIRPYTVGSMSSGTTDTESGARALRSVLASPWARRTWRDLGFTVLSAGLNLLPLLVMALPWTFFYDVPISLPAVLTCMFVSVAAAVALCPWLTVLRRACFYEVLGVRIPRPPTLERSPDSSGGVWSALRDRLRSPRTWRQACYHLVVGPAVNLLGLLGGLLWAAALIGLATSAVLALFTAVGVFRYAGQRVWDGAEIWIVLLSVVLVYLSPWIVSAAVRMDTRAAADLLGPSRAEKLAQRVAKLTESRAATVDAADAERRRIERDLHDGAQQRLVSLAMNLGLARATLADELSEPARRALQEAHEEAKEALTELRELVRGLHPVVLEDRGLDAALTGIAARSPVPVRLSCGRAAPGLAHGGGRRVLHRLRGPGQREQARPGHGGASGRAPGRHGAADHGNGRRDRRRGREPGHRPDRPGAAGRIGGRQLRDQQPARRTDDD